MDITVTDQPVVDTLKFISDEPPSDNLPAEIDKEDKTPARSDESDDAPIRLTESEEPPDIKEDDIDFSPAITKKALVAAFPEILKKFPQLENTIYRERAFSELFPSIADAKSTIERASTLDNTEALLAQGNIEPILDSIKTNDKDTFYRIIDSFFPTLAKLDQGAYAHVIGNVGKYFIRNAVSRADQFGRDSDQGKQIIAAAIIFNQLLFGDNQLRDFTTLAKPTDPNENKISEREKELANQRFSDVQQELSARATNAIKAAITQYIDPKESMTPYIREKAIDDCGALLDNAIRSDELFISKINKLWEQSAAANFSRESQEKIKSAYYSKAQSLLPDIIKSVRAKALDGQVRRRVDKEEVEDNPRVSTPRKDNGRSTSNKSGSNDGPRRGESTAQYLNRTMGD